MATSSPARSMMPSSSAPGGTPASSSLGGSRPIDPLNYQDVHGLGGTAEGRAPRNEEATGEPTDEQAAAPQGPRRFMDRSNIPLVHDGVGEEVMEKFQAFLEK